MAVGTVLVEPPPWEPARADGWRIRGMATRPDLRGRGLGGLVLDALVDHIAGHGGGLLWCNARVTALTWVRMSMPYGSSSISRCNPRT